MSRKPPSDPTRHSVLTSDVINEAEQTFKSIAKDGFVSQLDIVTIMRSMGMNPTESDLDALFDVMQIRDPERERQERIERDERLRKEKERREKEKAEAALKDDKKKMNPAAAAKKMNKKKKDDEKKEAYVWVPPEKRPVVDWTSFITHVEPFYKDNKIEEDAITQALKVFDKEGKMWMHKDELIRLLTTKGEDILSPPEVLILKELFPSTRIDFKEFAAKMQGTWIEPKPEEVEQASVASSRRTAGPAASVKKEGDNVSTISGSASVSGGGSTPSSAK
eukprot:TRINITY_DN85328_c0_g1_i1.p1 TRINITY_DN85328_c0_g1~~TRINITY_DN85328_c0_g1_i1.p1  ORF type:complete len:278 (-),score=55.08 TRINITY_DN85328_c0_g1_i1:179-1012(-)